MQTETFLSEEQKFNKIMIHNDSSKPKINDNLLNKWQSLINTITGLFGISASLIMKTNQDSVEVFLKNQNKDNLYEVGVYDFLAHALYCQTVTSHNKALYIKNVLEEVKLKDDPNVDLNMISYYGLPLNWPDKKTFGTICILDKKNRDLDQNSKKLLKEFRNVIEDDLRQLDIQEKLNKNYDKISAQKDKLKRVIDSIDAGTWEWNVQTGEIICNKKYEEMLGYESKEFKPITFEKWKELTHPEDLKKAEKILKKHFNNEIDKYDLNLRMKHKKGCWIWMNARGRLISWTDSGEPYKMYGVHIDISKQKKYEQIIKKLHKISIEFQKLESEKEICQQTIESAKEILEFDLSDLSLVKNNQFVSAAVSGGLKAEILPLDHGIMGKAFKNNKSYMSLDTEKDPDAKPTDEEYRSAIVVPIKNKGVFLAISTKKNGFNQKDLELAEILIASTKAALDKLSYQKELKYKSFYDSLTNINNRRFFEEELERLDTKRQLPISIIMADLNGLKLVNDSYGHHKGDQLLKRAAIILKNSIRSKDFVARLGGDEFAVLLPKTNREQLSKIVKRIKYSIDLANIQTDIPISIALGSATKESTATPITKVLKKADDKMYQNKLSKK